MSSDYAVPGSHRADNDAAKRSPTSKHVTCVDVKCSRAGGPAKSGRSAQARRDFDSCSRRLESSRSLEVPRSTLAPGTDSSKASASPVVAATETKASPSKNSAASKLLRKSSLGKSRTIRWLKQKYPSFESNGEKKDIHSLVAHNEQAPPSNCRRLVVLGSAKVGKTAIVSRFLGNGSFDDNYTPTIEDFHRKVYRIRGECYCLDILDTSGNHPFPAMRRISLLTGDLFVLVYSLDCRSSFDEVKRILEQISQLKQNVNGNNSNNTPILVLANKSDRSEDRVITKMELDALTCQIPKCGNVETSAKRDININEAFVRLFEIARLPCEMSPSLHRRVTAVVESQPIPSSTSSQPSSSSTTSSPVKGGTTLSVTGAKGVVSSGGSSSSGGGGGGGGLMVPAMSLRRRVSEACGAVAANVRRPSIRTDLLMMSYKSHEGQNGGDGHSHSKIVTACCCQ